METKTAAAAILITLGALALAQPASGERLPPNGITWSENIRGVAKALRDPVDCPDRRAVRGLSIESVLGVSFDDPGFAPAGAQRFRVLVSATTGPSEVYSLALFDGGEIVRAVAPSSGQVLPGAPVVFEMAWDAGELLDPSGRGVELALVFGGDHCHGCDPLPFHRTRVEAVEWVLGSGPWCRQGI